MEAIALGQAANRGQFCGNCFARLADRPAGGRRAVPWPPCEVCGSSEGTAAPAAAVPAEVLGIYLAKRRREGVIVNSFAFLGIFISLVLSGVLFFTLPGGIWEVIPFATLAIGSYYLARLLGFGPGATLGYRSGTALRAQRWQSYLQRRQQPSPTITQGESTANE